MRRVIMWTILIIFLIGIRPILAEDRLDTICKGAEFSVCLIGDDSYREGERDWWGCGCGDTREEAIAMFLTALVNQNVFVNFEFLHIEDAKKCKNESEYLYEDCRREQLIDKVFDYKIKSKKRRVK